MSKTWWYVVVRHEKREGSYFSIKVKNESEANMLADYIGQRAVVSHYASAMEITWREMEWRQIEEYVLEGMPENAI